MSRIWVVVDHVDSFAPALRELHRILQESIGDLKTRIQENRPIASFRLFYNDHDEVASRLRALMHSLPAVGAAVRFFETPEEYTAFQPADEISLDALENILTTRHPSR